MPKNVIRKKHQQFKIMILYCMTLLYKMTEAKRPDIVIKDLEDGNCYIQSAMDEYILNFAFVHCCFLYSLVDCTV